MNYTPMGLFVLFMLGILLCSDRKAYVIAWFLTCVIFSAAAKITIGIVLIFALIYYIIKS